MIKIQDGRNYVERTLSVRPAAGPCSVFVLLEVEDLEFGEALTFALDRAGRDQLIAALQAANNAEDQAQNLPIRNDAEAACVAGLVANHATEATA